MSVPDTSGHAAWQDLLDAVARCPHAAAQEYDQALQDGLGVAFYRVMMADADHRVHVEARTYGGPAGDFPGTCPPTYTRSAAHETLVRLANAFRRAPERPVEEDPVVLLKIGYGSTANLSERASVLVRAVALLAHHDPDDPRLPEAHLTLADACGQLGDSQRSQAMGRAAVEFYRRAAGVDSQQYGADLTKALCRVSELAAKHGQWEEAHIAATEALARIRPLHEGLPDHELATAPFLVERIQLACRAAHALRDRPVDASALFRQAIGMYGRHLEILGPIDDDSVIDGLHACLHDHYPLLPEGEPHGTLVIHDIGGVLFVEDDAEKNRRETYIDRVERARTYGEARAAGAPVDDFGLYEDYYLDLYLATHDDMNPDELNRDTQERHRRVRPPDEAPFDLERHPMYAEGEWWPLPANDGPWLGENFPSELVDNGGRVSSVEGWSPDDGDAITIYLLANGWAVIC